MGAGLAGAEERAGASFMIVDLYLWLAKYVKPRDVSMKTIAAPVSAVQLRMPYWMMNCAAIVAIAR